MGEIDGDAEGEIVGSLDGWKDGVADGIQVEDELGLTVGCDDGDAEGSDELGLSDGDTDGTEDFSTHSRLPTKSSSASFQQHLAFSQILAFLESLKHSVIKSAHIAL